MLGIILSSILCLAGAVAMLWVLKIDYDRKSFSLKAFQLAYCGCLLILFALQFARWVAISKDYNVPEYFGHLYSFVDMVIALSVIPYIYHYMKKYKK